MSLTSCQQLRKYSSNQVSSAQNYYNQALSYQKQKKHHKALRALEALKKDFPYSSYNSIASLLLADLHFQDKEYKKAEGAYRGFQKIYPYEKYLYVHYQLGRCSFYQLPRSADRDLSKAEVALEFFNKVAKAKSPYQLGAKSYIEKILHLKAEKLYKAASFYFKKDWKESSLDKFQNLIKNYPTSPLVPKALLKSYQLAQKLNRPTAAFKTQLLKQFPESKEAKSL